jgi:hypothetical protein
VRKLLLFLVSLVAFAGQSVTITGTQTLANANVPAQSANAPCQWEFNIADWDVTPADGTIIRAFACGLRLEFNTNQFQMYGDRQTGIVNSQTGNSDPIVIPVTLFSTKFVHFRFQIIPSGAGGTVTFEGVDSTGTRQFYEYYTYTGTSGSNANGLTLYAPGSETMTFAFSRLSSTTVAVGSRVPVYWTVGNIGDWKLDGDLTDGSGNGNDLTVSSGSPSYAATPYQSVQLAPVNTSPSPSWSDWQPFKVGTDGSLSCARAFAWSDTQGTETYAWSFTAKPSGAADPTFGTASAVTTTVSGHVFGPYTFRCAYTTTAAGTVNGDLAMGAVTYDSNGVVTPTDSKVSAIFGPLIALGQNPWGFADKRHLEAMQTRYTYYRDVSPYSSYTYGSNPSWANNQAGTVAYTFNGKGYAFLGGTGTTITAGINATDTSIAVADASVLDLSSLPTRIVLISGVTSEEVRICSTTGTTGAQTLTVCYDGRGVAPYSPGTSIQTVQLGAQSWSNGATLGQNLVKGTSTAFLSTVCPGGANTTMGAVLYSTGTVSLTASSTTMTGSGTSWVAGAGPGAGMQVGDAVIVSATHSGTAFNFLAYIQTITNGTTITLSRAFPASADTASGLSYQIIQAWNRKISVEFTRQSPYAGTGHANFGGTGCESDTQAFFNPSLPSGGADVSNVNGISFTGKGYSFSENWANHVYIANFGLGSIDFYGEELASYRLYFRSGSQQALDAARDIANNWVKYPGTYGGLGFQYATLSTGAPVMGAIICLVIDSGCTLSWNDVRPWIQKGADAAVVTTCLDADTRESAYPQAWLSLGAKYDPDGTWRSAWQSALSSNYTRNQTCDRADYSWDNSFFFNTSGPSIGLTNGSTAGTGTGIDASFCAGQDIVTVTVANGSADIVATVGTFNASATSIVLSGTYGGNPFAGFYQMTRVDSTHATLAVLWPGSSGSVPGMTTNESMGAYSQAPIAFGTSATDTTNLANQYICKFNSSTSITLDRPWSGTTASRYGYKANTSGYGQQPFMVGIMAAALRLSALSDSDIGTNFTAILNGTAGYLNSAPVYQADTHGLAYGLFGFSDVPTAANGAVAWKVPGLVLGMDSASIRAARALNAEIQQGFGAYASAQSYSAPSISWGDEAYGAIWGDCSLTTVGYDCDSNYVRDENSLTTMNDGKWYGFFFGMGAADQWPAARFGSVSSTGGRSIRGRTIIRGITR